MISIIANGIDVYGVFNNAFIVITDKITRIQLKTWECEEIMPDIMVTGIITTKGVFHAYIICEIQENLYEGMIANMSEGNILSSDDKILYLKEYLNIVCGKALTDINNLLGSRTRLSVPRIVQGSYKIESKHEFIEQNQLCYCSDSGGMTVKVYYKFLPISI